MRRVDILPSGARLFVAEPRAVWAVGSPPTERERVVRALARCRTEQQTLPVEVVRASASSAASSYSRVSVQRGRRAGFVRTWDVSSRATAINSSSHGRHLVLITLTDDAIRMTALRSSGPRSCSERRFT